MYFGSVYFQEKSRITIFFLRECFYIKYRKCYYLSFSFWKFVSLSSLLSLIIHSYIQTSPTNIELTRKAIELRGFLEGIIVHHGNLINLHMKMHSMRFQFTVSTMRRATDSFARNPRRCVAMLMRGRESSFSSTLLGEG